MDVLLICLFILNIITLALISISMIRIYKLKSETDTPSLNLNNIFTFSYTGTAQSLVVKHNGILSFEVWGAGGGAGILVKTASPSTIANGGNGGYQSGSFPVIAGDVITIIVGQGGISGGLIPAVYPVATYGGGGRGTGLQTYSGGSGGGRSALIKNTTDELVTSGGGGGGAIAVSYVDQTTDIYYGGFSGSAGYFFDSKTYPKTCGQGGTLTAGGAGAEGGLDVGNTGNPGIQFYGGGAQQNVANTGAGGGGGGYYGGGSGGSFSANGGYNGYGGTSGGGGSNHFGIGVTSVIDTGNITDPGGTTSTDYPDWQLPWCGYGSSEVGVNGGHGYVQITLT